jgi:drug/metabolite transporter (DMT)-like permease
MQKPIDRIKLMLTALSFLGVFIILNPTLTLGGSGFDWHILMPLVACLATCMNFLYLHEMRGCFKDIQVLQYTYSFQMVTSGLLVAAVGGTEESSPH